MKQFCNILSYLKKHFILHHDIVKGFVFLLVMVPCHLLSSLSRRSYHTWLSITSSNMNWFSISGRDGFKHKLRNKESSGGQSFYIDSNTLAVMAEKLMIITCMK